MVDPYGREITDLRISVTQRCNLNCPYCHREGEVDSSDEMSLEKIEELVKCATELDIRNIKITGGEPLLREDICKIIQSIAQMERINDIGLTTNGLLLSCSTGLAKSLKTSGLKRINIGCDSISSNIVSKRAESILPGLLAAKEAGLEPIKLNMVVLKNINHHEIDRMIEFAGKYNVILQLIELLPNGRSKFYFRHYFSLDALERRLEKRAERVETRKMQARKQYYLSSSRGSASGGQNHTIVEIVRPTHKMFCRNCNKLRVTSDGKIKPCLMRNDNLVDSKDKASFMEALTRRTIYNW